MESDQLLRFLPNLRMIAEDFEDKNWNCQATVTDESIHYRGVRVYSGQTQLDSDLIYLLPPALASSFPIDQYSFVSMHPSAGRANHIFLPDQNPDQVLETLLNLFDRYHKWEDMLNQLFFQEASLSTLCDLGETFTGNPFYIHDDWFIIIAMSRGLQAVMPPEQVSSSGKGFVPRKFIDDFKFDADYLESYSHRRASLWSSAHPDATARSMYVNLWDSELYRGRLLIIEENTPFRSSHFLLAECIAQRTIALIRKSMSSSERQYRSMDDTVCTLLEGGGSEGAGTNLLLDMLSWKRTDQYLCVRLQHQQMDSTPVLSHVLHSDLFQIFPTSYILFIKDQQCIILNLTKDKDHTAHIRYRLSPVCRDYCLYAGISSPVSGIDALSQAYVQAGIALERAYYLKNERWVIPFTAVALDYMLRSIQTPLQNANLVSPALLNLLAHDSSKGTEFFHTLRTYLLNERDIPKTAEDLIIHRTTLLYRLKKIQAMSGIDLDDPDERLYLLLSLKLLE